MRHAHAVASERIVGTRVMVVVVVDSTLSGRTSQVEVEKGAYQRWLAGAHVQDAFPELDAGQREILVTGIGPEEWAEVFGDGDEEPPAEGMDGREDDNDPARCRYCSPGRPCQDHYPEE
jgi:hypothetical protein